MTERTRHTIAGVGEILWDVFPEGAQFGGAPTNFACHAAAFGSHVSMLSGLGRDELGDEAIRRLDRHRVDTRLIQRFDGLPTGAVQVTVDEQGQPSYQFGQDEAWDHLAWSAQLARSAAEMDAICYGTLGQRHVQSRETIQRFATATPTNAWRIFDINLRPPFWDEPTIKSSMAIANALKLNDDELEVLTTIFHLEGSVEDRVHTLINRFDLRLVALTRGSQGAILATPHEWSECDGIATNVVDTVGAGDAFTATLCTGLLRQMELNSLNQLACRVAAFVCSQPGATPSVPEELTSQIVTP